MWLLLALFIIVKLFVYYKMQKMHLDLQNDKICPKNYYGLAPDPFDCNSYYCCPDTVKLFCPPNMQFDLEKYDCIDAADKNGCYHKLQSRLLL
ncbi:chtBD1 [Euproctis pseudoconspersa nucleopolyhedrovirus]|uniref:ChtBD1 n=1 Tax=Euproctis pseudoconspersa nucleopolyhedrovirus TaxID=307467 RepID=C3TWR8_9ABAC|nr:chtBD1 [Euproctis pseudoconspersa nucleopolyhedrovirus]ACO53460.1 chtBD1 [Euproctis pseudoconspersa nucleopolyhedrovirus]QUJ09204.1 chtBD1 protein [Gynaephora ruoergensis nucleopolyhedrovirus]